MINDIGYMIAMALIAAFISFAVMSFSKKAKSDHRIALLVQSTCILGVGFLFFVGASLQSVPGYSHLAIPLVFLLVLAIAHLVWRATYSSQGKHDG